MYEQNSTISWCQEMASLQSLASCVFLMSPVAKSFLPKDFCKPFGCLQFWMFYDVLCLNIEHLSLDVMFNPYIHIYIYTQYALIIFSLTCES